MSQFRLKMWVLLWSFLVHLRAFVHAIMIRVERRMLEAGVEIRENGKVSA